MMSVDNAPVIASRLREGVGCDIYPEDEVS